MQTDALQENQQRVWAQTEISQVSHLTGVNAKAIRYYESIGLLPRPRRGENHMVNDPPFGPFTMCI